MRCSIGLLLWLAAAGAAADVIDKAATGFSIKIEIDIRTTPSAAYDVLTRKVGHWWHPDHTFSGDAANLSINAEPGGCFCEQLSGGGLRHLEVTYVDAGKQLRMSGGLGPLHDLGVAGAMKFTFAGEDTTKLTATYAVGGYLPAGLDSWADAVDLVLTQQLTRLKHYIESGKPGPG